MKLHNTLTKSVDNFTPLSEKTVRAYSCGPTVYNHAHIGNLSSYIYWDILHRALRLAGYDVQRVMNITDIEDKIIRDSRDKFPELSPMDRLTKFTRHYEKIFFDDMALLGNDNAAAKFVRATENIAEMQRIIKYLLKKKIAYIADDGIYFDIAAYRKNRVYGQLTKIEDSDETRARIQNDEYDKDSAADFALWKKEKDGEPAWDFELEGENLRGRPGWHIECSAMSVKNLGQPFDIHTGGVDNIFPHHENEIAQSTAGDQPELYSNFFVHNEHLLVDGAKMSKSKNNFYTLPDIVDKGFDPLDFRMLVLQSHYRNATNFTWESLEAAQNRRRNWRNVAELRWQTIDVNDDGQTEIVNNLLEQVKERLLDDLDTPNALATLDQAFDQFSYDHTTHFALNNLIKFVDENLGLKLTKTTPDISDKEKNLIHSREIARAEKDFQKSDDIRDELLQSGIESKDSPNGSLWARK